MVARTLLIALTPLLLAPALALSPAAVGKPAKATIYLVAGVPGTSVDVLLDDKVVQEDVAPKSVIGPRHVTPGDHTVTFRAADWTATTDFAAPRQSVDVVVHRPADPAGDPAVTVFPNELGPISGDKARLTIAHTALVPPADVRASGKVLFANIANGEFVTAEVPATTYSVDIVPTGGTTPVFGPVEVTLRAGALNRVFAIGDPEDGTMDAIVQVLPLSQDATRAPTSVRAGSAGLLPPGDLPWSNAGAAGFGR